MSKTREGLTEHDRKDVREVGAGVSKCERDLITAFGLEIISLV